jgi:hypothetical protein
MPDAGDQTMMGGDAPVKRSVMIAVGASKEQFC